MPERSIGQSILSQGELDNLIQAVLLDRITTTGFDGIESVGGRDAKHFNVRADMLNMRLTTAALPALPGVEFDLLSRDEAAALAASSGQRVRFINISVVTVAPTEAVIAIGGDYAPPPEPGRLKLCCCAGHARYVSDRSGWTFQGWVGRQCS
jgi:hypothetical protein